MKHFATALICALCCFPGGTLANEDEWQAAVRHVQSMRTEIQSGNMSGADTLAHDVEVLSKAIDSRDANNAVLSTAHFYRADARLLENAARAKIRGRFDEALARAAIADFDKVIALGVDPDVVANAEYLAGYVASNHLHDTRAAFSYWAECARLEHAACLNIMAGAKLMGTGGVQVDIAESIALNEKVYRTGIRYTCAGAFSAALISETIYFFDFRKVDGDELSWLDRAYALLDQLAAARSGYDPCGRSDLEITEFLMRLDKSDRRDPILRGAIDHARQPVTKALAQYMLGLSDDATLRSALVLADPNYICDAHFDALWYLELLKRHDFASELYDAMSRMHCTRYLVFARKFGFRSL